jgi:hypothetical protein
MTWLRRHRLPAAEALERELARIGTDSAASELLAVAELLRAAARGLPPPDALRLRRRELLAVGASASGAGPRTGMVGRLIRTPPIAFAVAALVVASVLGATLVAPWLDPTPPSISEPAADPDPSTGSSGDASPQPRASQPEPPGGNGPVFPVLPDDLNAELLAEQLAALQAACGKETTLPDLSGLDEARARALVEALVAGCEAVPAVSTAPSPLETVAPSPLETPPILPDDLISELLADLQAACGEEANLPDLSGLDETEARALVDTLIAECETLPAPLLP